VKSARGARRPPHGLRLTIADGVAWLRLERPRAGNRITPALAQALCAAAAEIELDDHVTVVVVSAAGEDFCLGVEDGGDWEKRVDWVDAVARLTRPVVAAVQGDAVGEGMELALACDLRVVSERARFAMPQLAAGRLPRHGGTQRLPRLVGRMRALDLLFTGRTVAAREAEAIGLASRRTAPRDLTRAVHAVAGGLRAKAPIALRYAKEAVHAGSDLTFDQGTRLEEDLYVLLQTTGDRREGIEAFLHKRRPAFRGR
jgi:enoyl-CoA hydratase